MLFNCFVENGITEDSFYATDTGNLASLLKNCTNSLDFFIKFSFEKGLLVGRSKNVMDVELMDYVDQNEIACNTSTSLINSETQAPSNFYE